MKNDTLLTIASLLAIALTMFHLSDDVVHGFEPGGLKNLTGMAILVVWLVAALLLPRRLTGYTVLLLGSLMAAGMPILHLSGKGVGGAIATSSGGYFFIWTLFALGVIGTFSLILSVRGLWHLRRGSPTCSGSPAV